jgi:hypothetical protein
MKVLSEDEANAIVPAEERRRASKQERLERREMAAIKEMQALGFRVTWHQMPQIVEEDPLLGIPGGYKPGGAYALMYAVDGKRKHVAGCSAVDALMQAQSWWKWQQGLKPDAANKFVPANEDVPESRVIARAGSEVAREQRGADDVRKILSFASGTAEVVQAHGVPPHDADQAWQYRDADTERTTR